MVVVVGGGGWRWYLAPGTETTPATEEALSETKPKMDLSGAKFNRVWRRKSPFWNRKGTNRHPKTNSQAFPLVLGVKKSGIAVGKQPTKK